MSCPMAYVVGVCSVFFFQEMNKIKREFSDIFWGAKEGAPPPRYREWRFRSFSQQKSATSLL